MSRYFIKRGSKTLVPTESGKWERATVVSVSDDTNGKRYKIKIDRTGEEVSRTYGRLELNTYRSVLIPTDVLTEVMKVTEERRTSGSESDEE